MSVDLSDDWVSVVGGIHIDILSMGKATVPTLIPLLRASLKQIGLQIVLFEIIVRV